MTSANDPHHQPQAISRRRIGLLVFAMPLYFALSMFLPAGTWAWEKGWLFILVVLPLGFAALVFLWRVNPEVVVARSQSHQGTKPWDKFLVRLLLSAVYLILPVAALDDGRFHWFPVPWWFCIVGYILLLAGFGIVAWAEAVNKFFEVTVRIQTDRGHRVIANGPYAFVRHPGYVGGILVFAGMALSLGSLWALIPVGVAFLVLIVRTKWEDKTLQAELEGYKAYSERVRYKWIPGLW